MTKVGKATTMRTAEEWRAWYQTTQGHPVEPASLLSDMLLDLEELEAANRFLTLALAHRDGGEEPYA